jgi:predicted histidine transporter YuiF (NhaC family)
MRIFFSILSFAYIFGIFFFADSSVVSDLSSFNPYSLLHIPLYGILTALLIFSFVPLKFNSTYQINQRNKKNQKNQRNQRNQRNWKNFYLLPGGIALIVAIADEIHQAYVPGRDASLTDVLLDMAGIGIVIFFTSQLFRKKNLQKLD